METVDHVYVRKTTGWWLGISQKTKLAVAVAQAVGHEDNLKQQFGEPVAMAD